MRKEPVVLTCTVRWPEGMSALPSEPQFSRPSDSAEMCSGRRRTLLSAAEALRLSRWGWSLSLRAGCCPVLCGRDYEPKPSVLLLLVTPLRSEHPLLAVQKSGLRASIAETTGSISSGETKIPQAGPQGQNKQTKTHSLWLDRALKESPSNSRPLLSHRNIVDASNFLVSKFYRQKRNRWNKFNVLLKTLCPRYCHFNIIYPQINE